jgi:hypothetical protein
MIFTASDWIDIGTFFASKGDLQRAAHAYKTALALPGDHSDANANLAALAVKEERWRDAMRYGEESIMARPNAFALSSLSAAYDYSGAREKALSAALKSVQVRPDIAPHWLRLARAAQLTCDLALAEDAYNRILKLEPVGTALHSQAMCYRGMARMSLGRWDEGLADYERRHWALGRFVPEDAGVIPQWQGEPLNGKTILFCCEQGLGDIIMTWRWLKFLRAEGARIIIQGPSAVGPLVDMLREEVECLPIGLPTPDCVDYVVPSMSILNVLAKTYGARPSMRLNNQQYLFPPKDEETEPSKLRVGICWRGNPAHDNDRYRSMRLEDLKPVLTVEGCEFICLHHTEPERREALDAGLAICNLPDLAALARKVVELDLVITVDTCVAHLAGACGVPVWVLLSKNADWRWTTTGEVTPWYTSMHLLRQAEMARWDEPVQDAARRLDALARDGKVGAK